MIDRERVLEAFGDYSVEDLVIISVAIGDLIQQKEANSEVTCSSFGSGDCVFDSGRGPDNQWPHNLPR